MNEAPFKYDDLVQSRRNPQVTGRVRSIYQDDQYRWRLNLWHHYRGMKRGVLACNYRLFPHKAASNV